MKRWQKIVAVLAALVALVGGGVAVAGPAAADDDGEFPSCQDWTAVVGGPGREVLGSTVDNYYAHTDTVYVPGSWSACEDINVSQAFDTWRWRVRFYPSSGGNYVNAWKGGCDICIVLAATNVANGTRFRLEGQKFFGGSNAQVYQRNTRVRM